VHQIRRRLILSCRHQEAIDTQEIILLADDDLVIALGAIVFDPARARIWIALEHLVDAPRPRERVVDHRDLVMEIGRVGLVEMESLLEDLLIVEMQGQSGMGVGGASWPGPEGFVGSNFTA
jgi:hypothetical protein